MNALQAHPVVVGLDRSAPGRAVVEFAAELAHRALAAAARARLRALAVLGPADGRVDTNVEDVLGNSAQRLCEQTVEVLGVAYPDLEVVARLQPGSAAPADLVLVGLVAMTDPPRQDLAAVLEALSHGGIRVATGASVS